MEAKQRESLGGYLYTDQELVDRLDNSLEYLEHVPLELATPSSTLAVLPPSLIGARHLVQIPHQLLTAVKLLQRQWTRDFFVTSFLPPGIFVYPKPSLTAKQLSGSEMGGKWLFDLYCAAVQDEGSVSSRREKTFRPILTARGSGTTKNISLKGQSLEFTARTELEYSLSNKSGGVVISMGVTTSLGTRITDGSSPIDRQTLFRATFSGKHGEDSPKQTWISEPLISFGMKGVEKHGS